MSSETATSTAEPAGRAHVPPRIGTFAPAGLVEQGPKTAHAFLTKVAEAGIDHVCCGDHARFVAGPGFDGLVQAAAPAMPRPPLPVYAGVYLLPLRHPALVARQLADISQIAPGRLIFGVRIGGEERREVFSCRVETAARALRERCGSYLQLCTESERPGGTR